MQTKGVLGNGLYILQYQYYDINTATPTFNFPGYPATVGLGISFRISSPGVRELGWHQSIVTVPEHRVSLGLTFPKDYLDPMLSDVRDY